MLRTALVVAVPEAVAETYAALGRKSDAREHARFALPLLIEADHAFEKDRVHASRLRRRQANSRGPMCRQPPAKHRR